MGNVTSFLLGAITGAGVMYLVDPKAGRQRRDAAATQLRLSAERAQESADAAAATATEKAQAAVGSAQQTVSGKLDHATDKLTGAVADALPDEQPANAVTLVAKVRSEVLGNWSQYAINVDAAEGIVTLRGEVDPAHRDAIAEAVEGVTGVDEVENLLHAPGEEPTNVTASRRASATKR
jgi:osmotically-inducible protein OsmY